VDWRGATLYNLSGEVFDRLHLGDFRRAGSVKWVFFAVLLILVFKSELDIASGRPVFKIVSPYLQTRITRGIHGSTDLPTPRSRLVARVNQTSGKKSQTYELGSDERSRESLNHKRDEAIK